PMSSTDKSGISFPPFLLHLLSVHAASNRFVLDRGDFLHDGGGGNKKFLEFVCVILKIAHKNGIL
ncbi:MAG: hypothetical protein ACLUDG_10535, partial [Butyricicoccus sp.]